MYLETDVVIDPIADSEFYGFPGAEKVRQKVKFVKRYHGKCFYCQQEMTHETATKDHFFPRSMGHPIFGNMVLACAACNMRKSDKVPCRDLVVKYIKWWCLYPRRNGAVGELFSEFNNDQWLISLLEMIFGEPNIPGVIRAHV